MFEICLYPDDPGEKFSIVDAEFVHSHGSSVRVELIAGVKALEGACKTLSSASPFGDHAIDVNIVTDCKGILGMVSCTRDIPSLAELRYKPILDKIHSLSAEILTFADVELTLLWCPRNATPQLTFADELAKEAQEKKMSFYRRIWYSPCLCTQTDNDFGWRTTSQIMAEMEPELVRLATKYPII